MCEAPRYFVLRPREEVKSASPPAEHDDDDDDVDWLSELTGGTHDGAGKPASGSAPAPLAHSLVVFDGDDVVCEEVVAALDEAFFWERGGSCRYVLSPQRGRRCSES